MNSPLKLENYFFPIVQVVANPDAIEGKDINDVDYAIKTHVAKSESSNIYQVSVEISSPPEEQEELNQAYKLNLLAVGFFRVDENWPDHDKLLKINGSSILYSSAREFLITITSRMPYGAITLPTISFNNIHVKNEDEEKPSKAKRKSKRI